MIRASLLSVLCVTIYAEEVIIVDSKDDKWRTEQYEKERRDVLRKACEIDTESIEQDKMIPVLPEPIKMLFKAPEEFKDTDDGKNEVIEKLWNDAPKNELAYMPIIGPEGRYPVVIFRGSSQKDSMNECKDKTRSINGLGCLSVGGLKQTKQGLILTQLYLHTARTRGSRYQGYDAWYEKYKITEAYPFIAQSHLFLKVGLGLGALAIAWKGRGSTFPWLKTALKLSFGAACIQFVEYLKNKKVAIQIHFVPEGEAFRFCNKRLGFGNSTTPLSLLENINDQNGKGSQNHTFSSGWIN